MKTFFLLLKKDISQRGTWSLSLEILAQRFNQLSYLTVKRSESQG